MFKRLRNPVVFIQFALGVGHHVPVHFIQDPNAQLNYELLFNRPPSVVHEKIYLESQFESKSSG